MTLEMEIVGANVIRPFSHRHYGLWHFTVRVSDGARTDTILVRIDAEPRLIASEEALYELIFSRAGEEFHEQIEARKQQAQIDRFVGAKQTGLRRDRGNR